jgi:hypothetical protein
MYLVSNWGFICDLLHVRTQRNKDYFFIIIGGVGLSP